jgi:hypothetical protein
VVDFAIPLPGLVNASAYAPEPVQRPCKCHWRSRPGTIIGIAEREIGIQSNLLLSLSFIPNPLATPAHRKTSWTASPRPAFHRSETPSNRCAHSCYVTRISYFRTVIFD